ncbi:hypothetical protein AAFC00_000750 [Neodothiora populina]|uniref:FAD-binding domain-containing protein n=1 Tax=Neodothiora populina TaxID=2781224 RepID=A0ABR3PDY1_9PEZI
MSERRPGPLEAGRADALNARTQQVLEIVGVLGDLRPKGLLCNTSSVFKDGEFQSRNNRWWTSIADSAYKEFLMIGQADVERALVKHLDIDVLYETEVSKVSESDREVKVTVGGETMYSKYLIAADGGQSQIRKQLGIEFRGDMPNMRWAVLDTFIKTDFPVCNEIISFEHNGQSRVSWIPRERGMARFYILLEGEVTQEKSEKSIRKHMAPFNVEFSKTEWFSTYDVQERVAASFTSPLSKIILAGDASHIHAVNGGQGLNTGVADAFGLVWRLALAIRCTSYAEALGQKLLCSYDIERRKAAETVVEVAGKLVRSTLRTAQEYVTIVEQKAANITGMGVKYAPNVLSTMESCAGSFQAGSRFPDISFLKSNVVLLRLYEIARYGRFLIFNSGKMRISVPSWLEDRIDIWTVTRDGEKWNVTTSTPATLTTEHPFPEDAVVIMRPDFYIGYAGHDATSYFNRFSNDPTINAGTSN